MLIIEKCQARPRSSRCSSTKRAAKVMSGDEAVAMAALDAGIRFSSTYPGTPVTDIQETVERLADPEHVRVAWCVNEKVAYESALAVGIAGQRTLVSMKQVGLNVAADAFMTSLAAGTNGGMVLVVGDDPQIHSSPNKQDTRWYRALSGTVLLEPADAQEAYDMTREAFRLSERFLLPVVVRLTTRTAVGSSLVRRSSSQRPNQPFRWPKEPERFFALPTLSRHLFRRLADIQPELSRWVVDGPFSSRTDSRSARGQRLGIVSMGVGWALALEFAPEDAGILKVGGEPFPDDALASFVSAHDRIAVLEEGDPILEARLRALCVQGPDVRGRLSGHLTQVGELQPEEVDALVSGGDRALPSPDPELPRRFPENCKPCGYHKVFGALKEISGLAVPADIGCNTLGGLPPYGIMDGVWAMGSSIGVACGLASMGHRKVVPVIGDSTFFHSGIAPLVEAVHQGLSMTIVLLDNGTTAMTGGQGVPHRVSGVASSSVDMKGVITALGVTRCTVFNPHKLGKDGIRRMVEDSFLEPGVKVLLYRSPCWLYSPGYARSPDETTKGAQ